MRKLVLAGALLAFAVPAFACEYQKTVSQPAPQSTVSSEAPQTPVPEKPKG